MPLEIAIPKELRKLALFGSGVGIEVAGKDLHVVAVRVYDRYENMVTVKAVVR